MRRRLREYKKEKRMWCRYVAGAMALMMLAVSAPVTSAFGLENEEEEQATILTYKETDEGMVVDQFIPTEEAQASWEEGFQQAKAELEAEGYENIMDASDENNMVYVGGEDYVVPASYVADEEKDSAPMEIYDGEGGKHYLWIYVKANRSIANKLEDDSGTKGGLEYFWIRSSKQIPISCLKIEENKINSTEPLESINRENALDKTVDKQSDRHIANGENVRAETESVELASIFNIDSMIVNGIAAEDSQNVNPQIIGNIFQGYAPVSGGGIPTNVNNLNQSWRCFSHITSKELVSLKASWEVEVYFYAETNHGNSSRVATMAINNGEETIGFNVGSVDVPGRSKSHVNIWAPSFGNGAKIVVENSEYYDGTKKTRNVYEYNSSNNTATVEVIDLESGVSVRKDFPVKKDKSEIIFATDVAWGFPNADPSERGNFPTGIVQNRFVKFNYVNFAPQLINAKWYDSNGNELSKNSEILAGDKITVKAKVKNNSAKADQFDGRLKLSDDDSQVYTNGIDATGSGLDADGTAVILTNQEQEKTFVVTATRDISAGELALGIMLEDDFFHEKQYMQLHLGEQYGITYDGNLSSLDPAVNADAITVPEIARVPVGDSITVGNVSAAQIDSTDGTTRYQFTGWNTEADGSGYPYAAGASMTPSGATTLYAQWRNVTVCPLTLDVSDNSVKDKAGTLIADASTVHDGYTYDPVTGAVQIDERLFGGACNAPDGHVHTLKISGTKSDAGGLVTLGASDASAAPYNVSVEGVTAPGMTIQSNGGAVTFKGANLLGGGTNRNGLELTVNGGSVSIAQDASVTAYTTSANGVAYQEPEGLLNSLGLTMAKVSDQAADVLVANAARTIPAGAVKIAFLDNKDGSWLTTNAEAMKIETTDKSVAYVSGRTEENYKKTFELNESGVGSYEDVRLPKTIKQISLSVPTSVVFNVYTEGADNKNGDHGFIGPVYELKNGSYKLEDSYTYTENGQEKTAELGKTYESVEVSYQGVKQSEKKDSAYSLKSYDSVDNTMMGQEVKDNPIVCLEAEGKGIETKRVSLDQNAEATGTESWFKAAAAATEEQLGISTIQFKVPKAFTDGGDKKPWYQTPTAVTEEGYTLRGHHTLKLGFVLE